MLRFSGFQFLAIKVGTASALRLLGSDSNRLIASNWEPKSEGCCGFCSLRNGSKASR